MALSLAWCTFSATSISWSAHYASRTNTANIRHDMRLATMLIYENGDIISEIIISTVINSIHETLLSEYIHYKQEKV